MFTITVCSSCYFIRKFPRQAVHCLSRCYGHVTYLNIKVLETFPALDLRAFLVNAAVDSGCILAKVSQKRYLFLGMSCMQLIVRLLFNRAGLNCLLITALLQTRKTGLY